MNVNYIIQTHTCNHKKSLCILQGEVGHNYLNLKKSFPYMHYKLQTLLFGDHINHLKLQSTCRQQQKRGYMKFQ